jgi:predicted Zn-dependent protease
LFLGQVLERAGRADDAARAFQQALLFEPQSQAAAVALSHVLLSSGDALGARRVLEKALGHSGRRPERDPYWDYPSSNAATADLALQALRIEASE